jgi:hypothetical protein
MQAKIMTYRQPTDPLKMWYSSNIWGQTITNQNLIQEEINTGD